MPAHFQTYRTETHREGPPMIDIIDAKIKNLVGRGSMVDSANDLARIGQQFAEAARNIIENPDGNNATGCG